MSLRLVAVHSPRPAGCVAEFERGPDRDRIVSAFVIDDVDGFPMASAERDPFAEFDGTAEDLRQIRAVVVGFVRISRMSRSSWNFATTVPV